MSAGEQAPIGVVLLNLGGPERVEEVRPFLYNLFSDRLIIRLGPACMQKPLAWLIAKRRAPKSQGYYRQIGGGSPLNRITAAQCQALERELAGQGPFRVDMVMRYWHPLASETIPKLLAPGLRRLVALSLYPHYSVATTGSSLADLRDFLAQQAPGVELLPIESWPEAPEYIDCLARRINDCLADGGGEVIYSAHSLPVKFIAEGDPYVEHLKKTIALVEARTGKTGHLCFQSRSGPVEWLSPSTPETITRLAQAGCRRLVVVPISFVSDHVETLCEIDLQYRDLASGLGVELIRTPSLNTDPHFIAGLARLVVSACQGQGWR
ncbi:MAG: ferrochelatase [Desulfobacteraceae bacterium]|nr:ferrochelatase [Desulfobacteraceae bacterium]